MPRGGGGAGPLARRSGGGGGNVARIVLPLKAPARGVKSTALRATANSPGAPTIGRCA